MAKQQNREDGFGSQQRGEETSRLETRLDAESVEQGEFGSSVMEGMHASLLTRTPPVQHVLAQERLVCCVYQEAQGSLPPGRGTAVRSPYAYQPRACRTYRDLPWPRRAEDNPQMAASIKAAERMGQEDTAAADATRKEYLAASADGSVRRMQGDPSYAAMMPHVEDNTWDVLKKKRLAEMKLAAQQKHAWRELGHGTYARLESEARFLQELAA